MIVHGAKFRSEPEVVKARLADLAEAFALLTALLHKFDGTQPDSDFGTPEMRITHQHLSTAWLWAKEAVEKN